MKAAGRFLACVIAIAAQGARAQSFEVAEASIAEEQKAMAEGRVTSRALTQAYLNRIEAFDHRGPRLNALMILNPNALREAEALDRERAAKGPRGPLHGIPVIVKDNYSTADMQTTAGTMALLGFVPSSDAFQVRKLREAGAVLLGKSNLHELASGITTVGSAFGQTLNPYDPSRNPGGSSGGTGAAIAASFAAAGMGSDTCGSIRIPSANNNLVGLRPTKGLSSIAGIVPLSTTQDVGGPLARSVADLAVMLDGTIGEDPADAATHLAPGQTRPRFTDALQAGVLKGAHIGILEPLFGDASDDQEVIRVVRAAIEELKKEGASAVSVPMPDLLVALDGSSFINAEFKEDLANYLAKNGNAPVHSLEEIVRGGLFHTSLEAALNARLAAKGRDSYEYKIALAKRSAIQQTILKLMEEQKLDALVYPTLRRKPALIGVPQGGSGCQLSASTGFPAISMPAGFTEDGLPVGVELLGRAFDDAKLVSFAYAYEQATHHRRAPARTPALAGRSSIPLISWQSSASGGNGSVSARFTFDLTTNDLTYMVTASGFAENEILSATMHRRPKSENGTRENGPAFAILANRAFKSVEGTERLSDPDREKLMSGDLYLRIGMRSKITDNMRISLKPAAGK
ncbi:MAG TPA: amidase family protein [Bryobacteraceae bacterium]|nr:amidase family protein [Bryobacteraceae bacterium]